MITPDTAMLGASKHERHERDHYPTIDQDVTHVLCRTLVSSGLLHSTHNLTVWEPAAGSYDMSDVLEAHFGEVLSSDIVPLDERVFELDFLAGAPKQPFQVIVTNPPFGKELDKFIARGIQLVKRRRILVALLARNEIDCAGSQRAKFFGACPEFSAKIVLGWRPRWFEKVEGEKNNGPRHNYAWYVWRPANLVQQSGGAKILYAGRP